MEFYDDDINASVELHGKARSREKMKVMLAPRKRVSKYEGFIFQSASRLTVFKYAIKIAPNGARDINKCSSSSKS